MPEFFSRLSYSLGNEDDETEHLALNLQPHDRVLCVTGSGDRPLHLLLKDCREVVAIDANPIQNHLLRLKMSALQQLEFEGYLSFLGAVPDKSRLRKLEMLLPHMDPNTSKYWQKNSSLIKKGVLYQGAMEKYALGMYVLARLIQGRFVKKLFSFSDINEQRQFVDRRWDNIFWKKCFQIVLSPKISKFILRDPGLYSDVDKSICPGTHIYERMNECLKQHLAQDNFFISLLLKGIVTQKASPAYLQKERVQIIKERLNRITIQTGDLIHYLETCPENSFDAFSLSDVASYISEEAFFRLLKGVTRAAKPGARFCIREFLSRRQIPQDLERHFQRNYDLEKHLEDTDRCFVYRFLAGKMKQSPV